MSVAPEHRYIYRGAPQRVVDGDTIVVEIDLGFGVHLGRGNEGAHLRLLNVDTPERNEPGWSEASEFTREWLADAGDGWSLLIESVAADSFGRYLATVYRVNDGRTLNADLLISGHAAPYERT